MIDVEELKFIGFEEIAWKMNEWLLLERETFQQHLMNEIFNKFFMLCCWFCILFACGVHIE